MKRRVTVLGSTGSIGANTLDVIARHPQRFEVFALSASRQVDAMFAQCARFRPRFAVMAQEEAARELARQAVQLALQNQAAAVEKKGRPAAAARTARSSPGTRGTPPATS